MPALLHFSANSEKVVQQVLDELGLTLTDEVTPFPGLPKLIILSYQNEEIPGVGRGSCSPSKLPCVPMYLQFFLKCLLLV